MEILVKLHLTLHIISGILTLIMGPIAIISNNRNIKIHLISGKIFFWAMLYACFSAILGFFRHDGELFYTFLSGLSVMIVCNILRGIRAIQLMKGDSVKTIDFIYTGVLAILGVAMMGMGLYQYYLYSSHIAFTILFNIFGLGSLMSAKENWSKFTQPHLVTKAAWLYFHVTTMIGAFIASTTAFTVNTAHYLPWYIQWFAPTFILLPLQFYWKRRLLGTNPKIQRTPILN